MTKPVLGYWKIRGLAAQLMYQLEYCGVAYDMQWYDVKQDGTAWDTTSWTDVKFTLGLDFPNIPYLKDGEFQMTETRAIHKYIAAKWCPDLLLADDPMAYARAEQMGNVIDALKMDSTMGCYMPTVPAEEFLASLIPRFEMIAKHITGKQWVAGERLSWADFQFGELLDMVNSITSGALFEAYPVLKEYKERFFELKGIKEFVESDRTCTHLAFNNKMARFGQNPQ